MNKKNKTAVMIGAGSIGRGFLGQLFYLSSMTTCFIDVNQQVVDLLNEKKQYPLTIATPTGYQKEIISNVYAILGTNLAKTSNVIANCDVLATAVGVNVLPHIAKMIASGINQRTTPLNIIICENMLDSGTHLKSLVAPYITNKEFFEKNIGFIPASVGRMVPVIKSDNPLEVIVEPYNELQIDSDQIKGILPDIKNVKTFSPFDSMKKRKLFMHNMSHALCAYLGHLKGYEYISDAIRDPLINRIVLKGLHESATAISKAYNISYSDLQEHGRDLVYRYHNTYLKDTVKRVGRDPKRKLHRNDRLVGAALFCLSQDITPTNIIYGIKAALSFEKGLSMADTHLLEDESLYKLIITSSLLALDI